MTAPKDLLRLVEKFHLHLDSYKAGAYHETQLRRACVDPFFRALGWDVDNVQGWAEAYKEVIHEDALKLGGTTKAPRLLFSHRRHIMTENSTIKLFT